MNIQGPRIYFSIVLFCQLVIHEAPPVPFPYLHAYEATLYVGIVGVATDNFHNFIAHAYVSLCASMLWKHVTRGYIHGYLHT
jgi:hypothetical protein